ncbi:unnamed protein product, partial [Thlaspi arvense]
TMGKQVERKFTWVINNLSSSQSEILYSDSFVIGGCKWRLIAYPKRKCLNNLTLEVADCEYFLPGWRRQANFSLTILNQVSEKIYRRHVTQHWFDHKNPEFCFTLSVSTPGYLVDQEVKIVAEIDVRQVVDKVDVHGFQVLPSHVNRLFEKHPEIASKFRIKSPLLKTAYMNILLSLTETLRLPPQRISEDDLSDAETNLAYMTKLGFKLDWLENKFGEVKEKKGKEKAGEIRMQCIEEKLKVLKQKCSDLEALLEKEKAEVLAARAPVSLSDDDDVV